MTNRSRFTKEKNEIAERDKEVEAKRNIVNIDNVINYCYCPMYYELKKNDEFPLLRDKFNIAMHKCFYHYIMALYRNDGLATMETLKKKFAHEWIKNNKQSKIILKPIDVKKPKKEDSLRKKGIDDIIGFIELMGRNSQTPIAINKPYEVKIAQNIYLRGKWEYIREIEKDGKPIIQIISLISDKNKFTTNHMAHHDLKLTADALAFKEIFGTDNFETVYMDISNQRETVSNREDYDFRILVNTVKSVALSIKYGLKCMSVSDQCYYCERRQDCQRAMRKL